MNNFSVCKQRRSGNSTHTVAIIAYPGVEIINIVGPMEVFSLANVALQQQGLSEQPIYKIEVLAQDKQPIKTLSGLQILPAHRFDEKQTCIDTLIIPGGIDLENKFNHADLITWTCKFANQAERIAAIGNSTFILAEGGLLNGSRATTHWQYTQKFKQMYPEVLLEKDKIFVHDGRIWSSGGLTSSIDLALALLEEDRGQKLAMVVAQSLLVYLKRSGNQTQISQYLQTEAGNRRDLRELQAWIMENPHADLKVETLANKMAMSPRNFARVFLLETGITPAKFIKMVRVDHARNYLETTALKIDEIAYKVGFKDSDTLRKTFCRHYGMTPVEYREAPKTEYAE